MAVRDQLEGRNVVIEALRRQRRPVTRIWLDERARPGAKVDELLALADAQGVPVQRVARQTLDRRSATGAHNGVIAEAEPLPEFTVVSLLGDLAWRKQDPFLVLVDEVQYEHNLGAILRSALGSGVNGVIVPTRRGKGLSPVVARVAMGGAEEVPVVREGLSSALATIRRAGVRVVGCDMKGRPMWKVALTGPIALVLGGEDKGLSPTLRKRCDEIAAVPLAGQLDSLNVSVSAALMMFEKVRQERSGTTG
ncbi:MAG: 23S rRNA (guanosine(2251)-2'-O)-methyltransferase RlmB [Oligoflexia bacterium]|nr:23S rRNA (guanosine(2251)-2'-O)-methyltransferase RlmB [Oligoflexia bacterium]